MRVLFVSVMLILGISIQHSSGTEILSAVKKTMTLLEHLMKIMVSDNEHDGKKKDVIEELKTEQEKIKMQLAKRSGKIAFTAQVHQSADLTTTANAPIKFSHVLTNNGNAYNATNGIFYCPEKGFYFISTGLAFHNNLYVYVKVDGVKFATMYKANGAWGNVAGTFVIKLAKGDKVWLEISHRTTLRYGSHFSGFKIY